MGKNEKKNNKKIKQQNAKRYNQQCVANMQLMFVSISKEVYKCCVGKIV